MMNNQANFGRGEAGLPLRPRSRGRNPFSVCALLIAMLVLAPWPAAAAPTTADQARAVVTHWLASDAAPLGSRLGAAITGVTAHANAQGETAYYVVALSPAGFAVVSADDLIEPIVAFSSDGTYDAAVSNPFGQMVERDLPSRLGRVRPGKGLAFAPGSEETRAQAKWTLLAAVTAKGATQKIAGLSDTRVTPFLQSQWSQDVSPSGTACYNYYTPPYGTGNAGNYPCGCVATAMAQVMRYFTYPTVGVGTAGFTIKVGRKFQTANLRGGNGTGGAYPWSSMPLKPGAAITAAQCQAIGTLTYDAGVAVMMQYAADGSGAMIYDAYTAMTTVFKYANCYYATVDIGSFPISTMRDMMNASLDAGFPLILGIGDTAGNGHAVVCDGYGFNVNTPYHHLNMGWSGLDDAWYNLPNIDASMPFTIYDECLYNISPGKSGEIISGRVTDGGGTPLAGVTVIALNNGVAAQVQTNSHGIYALSGLPESTQYHIYPTKAGMSFTEQTVTTGITVDYPSAVGNKWGVDFQGVSRNAAQEWRGYE